MVETVLMVAVVGLGILSWLVSLVSLAIFLPIFPQILFISVIFPILLDLLYLFTFRCKAHHLHGFGLGMVAYQMVVLVFFKPAIHRL